MTDELGNALTPWERNFVAHMAYLRESKGMTQTDLARRLQPYGLKFHQQTVQRVEAGERPVRLNEAHIIAQVLESDLNVMTTDVASSDLSLRYAVTACRTRGTILFDDLTLMLSDWLDEFDALAALLAERDLNGDLSAGTTWALEWLWRTREVAAHLIDTRTTLGETVLGKSEVELHVEAPSFDIAGEWMETLYKATLEYSEDSPDELMRRMEGANG